MLVHLSFILSKHSLPAYSNQKQFSNNKPKIEPIKAYILGFLKHNDQDLHYRHSHTK